MAFIRRSAHGAHAWRGAAVAFLALALLVPALPAGAATVALTSNWCLPVDDGFWVVGGQGSKCPSAATPVQQEVTFGAGEARFMFGRLEASSSTTAATLQVALVHCGGDNGTTTSQNNLGNDAGTTLTPVRYLFQASSAGAVGCALKGRGRAFTGTKGFHFPVQSVKTFLEIADDNKAGAARWGTPEIQIGGSAPVGSQADVLVATWEADPSALTADIMADAEITTCNAPSTTCDLYGTSGSGSVVSGSTVSTHLEAAQLSSDGTVCRTTRWPATLDLRTTVSNPERHLKVFHGGAIPIDTSCSARRFEIKLHVRLLSGNVITVESGRFSGGIAMNVLPSTPQDATPPATPQGLSGAGGDARVVLDWSDNLESDLGAYTVERTADGPAAPSRTWAPVALTSLNVSEHTDTGLTNGTPYFYRVSVADRAGNTSAPSAEISATPIKRCAGFERDPRNQIVGTAAGETLTGSEGPDVICGLGGNDVLRGLGGNDLVLGGSGNDRIDGGAGNDQLEGGEGDDLIYGVAGDDVLDGGGGADVLAGGDGGDRFAGGDGADRIFGGAGDDVAYGQAGDDRMYGNAGADRLSAGDGHDGVDGGADADHVWGGNGNDSLFGGAGNDVIYGGPGNDRIDGGAGDDGLVGGVGDDILFGGDGADRLYAQAGDDRLLAKDGARDIANGGDGATDRAEVDRGLDRVAGVERVFT